MDINDDMILKAKAILCIGEPTTIRKIKSSYRKLWHKNHPDKRADNDDETHERLAELKRSYDTLMQYCENYEISFNNKEKGPRGYDHAMRFYDGWLGDLK
ncbi:MAG: J domain-containing protein [Spirochaetes bacterium]|nr:J domain-containing protein [Spirochaetota bacterium]